MGLEQTKAMGRGYRILLFCFVLGVYSMLFMSEIIEISAPRFKRNMISEINFKVTKTAKCYTDHIQEKD